MRDQPAGHRHHRDRHVRERPSRVELLARGLQAGGEPPELLARLDRADLPGGVLVAARADQVAGVTVARGGDDLAWVRSPIPRRGVLTARASALASRGLTSRVR